MSKDIPGIFKCMACWRVYDRWQLTEGPYEHCKCGSFHFKNVWNVSGVSLRRFLTDPIHIIKTWAGKN